MRATFAAILLAAVAWTPALAETCTKSGEETSGMGKVCYYRCTFGTTTENVGAARLCPLTSEATPRGSSASTGSGRSDATCFKTGEETTGMTKQCIYSCGGTRKVETVGAAKLCPLTAH